MTDLDQALAPIAQVLRKNADALLDLRASAQAVTRPGLCVSCYFILREALAKTPYAKDEFRLCPLRNWLEERIQIQVSNESEKCLERVPVRLGDAPDLETYCRQVMEDIREDRSYPGQNICLDFAYNEPGYQAA